MKTFTLTIDGTDNDAFGTTDDELADEVGCILERLGQQLQSEGADGLEGVLLDHNGNAVGRWELSE